MKSLHFQPHAAEARPFAAAFRCGVVSLALMASLHGVSAHAEPPGAPRDVAAPQAQRFEWRQMLTVDPDAERREAGRRRLSDEERERLRRDVRDASRDGYSKQPQVRNKNGKGKKSR